MKQEAERKHKRKTEVEITLGTGGIVSGKRICVVIDKENKKLKKNYKNKHRKNKSKVTPNSANSTQKEVKACESKSLIVYEVVNNQLQLIEKNHFETSNNHHMISNERTLPVLSKGAFEAPMEELRQIVIAE